LWPKVPATVGLMELGLLTEDQIHHLRWVPSSMWSLSPVRTFQEVWIDFKTDENNNTTAYLHFDFYNGAMSTGQCSHLVDAMDYVLVQSATDPIRALVLMGGAYFSNGIALNVIEAAADPSMESWYNINRIDDVVLRLLQEFPARGILTVAAVRGNAAAGGVALAAACDVVIAGANVVLNPAYRGIGLFGSEYHTISYFSRCGKKKATEILRAMRPLSPLEAREIGLVDFVFPGHGMELVGAESG
jgi:enoyl-CoA hydratase/carnithine racemase